MLPYAWSLVREKGLQELKHLHDKRLISDEEYAQQRERILSGL